MSAEVVIVNADRITGALARWGRDAVPALARGLYEEAAEIFRESQALVPHDTGVLMGSGMIHPPSIVGDDILVEITYGGNASAYAAYQHETVGLAHDPGRTDHYLEDPFDRALDGLDGRLLDRIEAIVRGLV